MKHINDNYKGTDKIIEGFCYYLGYHHVENTGKSLDALKEEVNKIDYPKELDEWFDAHLKNYEKIERKNKKMIFIKKLTTRIAVLFIFLGISMTIVTLNVEAFRTNFFNFITDISESFTSVQVEEIDRGQNPTNIHIDWINYYLPEYVPESYQLDNLQVFDENKILYYKNKSGEEIQFSQSPIGNNFQLDTEHANSTEVIINEQKGMIIEKNNVLTLLWFDNINTYYLIGKINKIEIIKMAESVQLVNK